MKKELEEQLVKLHPQILRDYGGDMRNTCMTWGMMCGDGWYDLLNDLMQTIDDLVAGKNIVVIADQIKEKFGGLRFYYHIEMDDDIFDTIGDKLRTFMYDRKWGIQYNKILDFKRKYLWRSFREKIRDAVNHAEHLSYEICETCGKPGDYRYGGWAIVLCDKCENNKEINCSDINK